MEDNEWNNICSKAAAYGQLECLQYAYNNGVPLQLDILHSVVASRRSGALECVKFLHEHGGLPLNQEWLCEEAVWTNNLEMLKYLHENGCPWNAECYLQAIGRCDEEVFIEYLHTNGCPWDAFVCEYAAKEGYPGAVLFFLRHGCPPSNNIWRFKDDVFQLILQAFEEAGHAPEATPSAMSYIVRNGDLNAVKLMREKGFEWTADACARAAVVGSLELLQYVHHDGAFDLFIACGALMHVWTHDPTYTAGKMECFKYAHQQSQCKLHKNYTFTAARDGQLELLMYLHEQGCKWDAKAAVAAAKNGHVECLEYMLSEGCPHSKDICIVATKRRQEKCLEVAKKYGCF